MGIVKINDDLHEDIRKASSFMVRSINAQAEYWIKIGMLAEANPGKSFNIRVVKPGATLGDIGHAILRHATKNGYTVVREYCGHGIGREMHEAPSVLHYGQQGKGLVLQEGMTFTIEPMINQGKAKVKQKNDGWTVVTSDKKLSAQWEHTIAVTSDGFEVLTLRDEERL